MKKLAALLALGITIFASADALARTPTMRTTGQRDPGVKGDHAVPYLTTGNSAFFSGFVGPQIISCQNVIDPVSSNAKPVYNIIFYGAKQSFGDKFNGATSR
jgi:hypothetical protein